METVITSSVSNWKKQGFSTYQKALYNSELSSLKLGYCWFEDTETVSVFMGATIYAFPGFRTKLIGDFVRVNVNPKSPIDDFVAVVGKEKITEEMPDFQQKRWRRIAGNENVAVFIRPNPQCKAT